MEYQKQLKLQAFLDGELPEAERCEVANWLAREQEAAALLTELRQTRQAVVGFEKGIKLPESREFYWGKIQREIERLERPAPERTPAAPSFSWLRRVLVSASGLAVLVIAGFLLVNSVPIPFTPSRETALADTEAFTYRDFNVGATLVWLSYPAENEVVEDELGALN
jgi:anti-sigma factor RsiW